jgi:hypothetical protein
MNVKMWAAQSARQILMIALEPHTMLLGIQVAQAKLAEGLSRVLQVTSFCVVQTNSRTNYMLAFA